MATIRYSIRQKRWMVTWRSHGTVFQHMCDSEETALAFSEVQRTISRKEKELFVQSQLKIKSITIRELFDQHFLLCLKNPTTIKQDLYHAKSILNFFGNKKIASITKKDILTFCNEQKISGKAQSTIHRRVSLLRSILNWGRIAGLTSFSFESCSVSKGKNRRTPPPSISELNALLRIAAPHIQRVILLGVYTGARIGPSELFSLTWDDIDLKHGVISMPNAQKGGKLEKRDIPIRKDLLPILARWQQGDAQCPYVINWAGKQVQKIAAAWKTAIQKSGIRPVRPYDLRHAYATYSIRSGTDIKTSAEIMGHENARMILEVYEHVDWSQKVRAIENMPDFFALTPGTDHELIHERRPRQDQVNQHGADQCIGDAVPACNKGKGRFHSEVQKQPNHPSDKDTQHERQGETEYPPGMQCTGKEKSRNQNNLSQQTKENKLKNEIQKPHPLVSQTKDGNKKNEQHTQS